jgi:hypothetical protein
MTNISTNRIKKYFLSLFIFLFAVTTAFSPFVVNAQSESIFDAPDDFSGFQYSDFSNGSFLPGDTTDYGQPIFDFPYTDPTIFTQSQASGGGSASITGAVGGCAASLVTGFITNKIGAAVGGALNKVVGNIPVIGGLLGGEVPVNDATTRQNTGAISTKETSLDSVAFCLANSTIEAILNGTIQWVNSGFDGNPVFIDNPEKFFGDIADYEIGQVLNELSGGILCSQFDIEVRLALLNRYGGYGSGGGYRYGDACTLSDIINNVDGFLDGDFTQGGWDGWFALTQKPVNNPFGAYIIAEQEINRRVVQRQQLADFELGINNGFLSIRDDETGDITTPGLLTQQKVSERLGIPEERLTFADEFDELMDALINQFIKMAIGEIL